MRRICFVWVGFLLLNGCPSMAQSYFPEKENSKIKVKPKAPVALYGFDLKEVRLLPGSPFKNAMDRDAEYILSLEPDRLLHRFHLNAGLPTKGEVYEGWESLGLSGHTLGHYLSACAMMYASTGDERFRQKADYVVSELAKCQTARKSGYVGAIPNEDSIFWKLQHGIIKTSGFDLNGGWSPWYTVHKVMAGLADTYMYCDNAAALKVLVGLSDWTENILKDLSEDQLEQMRKCEYGGMNDILVHMYELTANQKYLDLSYKFHDHFILEELAKHEQPLNGKHSNTNVPKAIGVARRYDITTNAKDQDIAKFFWETIVKHHTYVIGGNSNYEYLGNPDKLSDRLSDDTCETCNTYNMLKLTRFLFSWNPDRTYGDYYERALYNHILSSQNPQTGMMCYFVPLRMGAKKEFSTPFTTFTCCVGSGIENHSKYTEGIYYQDTKGGLLVNLFIPSTLNWKEKGVTVTQETDFPESDKVKFTFKSKSPVGFELKLRSPGWAVGKPMIQINGKSFAYEQDASGFIRMDRQWNSGDRVEVQFPMGIHAESMPDNQNRIAMLYGPVVLAGQLGSTMPDPVFGTSVLLTANKDPQLWVKKENSTSLSFRTDGVVRPKDVELIPFYKTVDQYYNVYWDYFTPEDWAKRQADYEAEKKRQYEIDAATVDWIRIGEMQPERDHGLKASQISFVTEAFGQKGREARSGGFFSFNMRVNPVGANRLLCTYIGDDKGRVFDLLVDEKKIATEDLKDGPPARFFDVIYPIPTELTKGKTAVVVKVQGHPNKTAGRVFGCRILQ